MPVFHAAQCAHSLAGYPMTDIQLGIYNAQQMIPLVGIVIIIKNSYVGGDLCFKNSTIGCNYGQDRKNINPQPIARTLR